jgi:hypothetical protein
MRSAATRGSVREGWLWRWWCSAWRWSGSRSCSGDESYTTTRGDCPGGSVERPAIRSGDAGRRALGREEPVGLQPHGRWLHHSGRNRLCRSGFPANRGWLHPEARYNYENLRTGSLWVGYNFSAGKKLVLEVTPMIGGVFGRTNGIAPGCGASLTYKKIELSISNEYVFDTTHKSGNFYYSWPQLTYSPVDWFHLGLVAQRTKAFHTSLDTQRGFLVAYPTRSGNLRPIFSMPALPIRLLCLRWASTFEGKVVRGAFDLQSLEQ